MLTKLSTKNRWIVFALKYTFDLCWRGGGGVGGEVGLCVFILSFFAKRSRLGKRPNEPNPAGKHIIHQLTRHCHHLFSIRAHLFSRNACPPPAATQHAAMDACIEPFGIIRPKMWRFAILFLIFYIYAYICINRVLCESLESCSFI